MLGAYGGSVLALDYDSYFGLWLNLPRQRRVSSWVALKALELARGQGRIPEKYFDAVTSCEAESIELEYQTNKARWAAGEGRK